ncbi:FMN-dependent NADH-azoreductase [Pelagibacterium halotolerans]|uniref:Putative acyl carrier protein phosphodiesterase n=1 Tax=Pelagibacterium halotolerans (strain DSM 22347 / JCM 15775 / CGMCC 1.7692 / B2) TaxID=1082931 RepID=G4RF20_PELHB|nr:NAD(P)H-dependent oxidoreductase [Pelagibacterium halotolerans]AEQ52953.1 putative acyl carrier protein phosphodiesterase [Pelagibacterium halotolerans B2]QJR17382.1 flavodoxin family protein [Pelagibacterium halotolerans]SEA72966.1 FMN-dependent NADH-azoreductase [Pelagibacterium halotolerans]
MPTLFRLDASIRNTGSVTRALADTLEDALVSNAPGIAPIKREIGLDPLPSTAWADAVFAPHIPQDQRSAAQLSSLQLARTLADELIAADVYLFAVPFYNFGVSQHFKTWVDLVLTDPRLSSGVESPIKGRPATLIVARGGGYGPGTPRHGWDHGTAWYRRVLEDIWMLDLRIVECELTLADVTPAMAELRGLAAENLENAHALAGDSGRRLAGRLAA